MLSAGPFGGVGLGVISASASLKKICVCVKHLSSFSKTGICKNELIV